MKNELAFIPDNISAIEGTSINIHPTSRFEPNDLHGDSTDMFIDEILKQRTERLEKEKEKGDSALTFSSHFKALQDLKDPPQNYTLGEGRLKQSLKASRDKQGKFELKTYINESIAEKPQLSQIKDSNIKSEISNSFQKNPQNDKEKQAPIQTLHNQSNRNSILQKQLHEISNNETQKQGLKSDSQNRFVLPKIDRISNNQSNVSLEQINYIDEKLLKQNTSFNSSEKHHQLQNVSLDHSREGNKKQSSHSEVKQGHKVSDMKKSYSNLDKLEDSPSNKHSSKSQKKIEHDLQGLQSKIQSNFSGMDTPAKLLNEPQGFYELIANKNTQHRAEEEQEYKSIAMAITERLNENHSNDSYQLNQLHFNFGPIEPVNEVSQSHHNIRKSNSKVNNPSKSTASLKKEQSKEGASNSIKEVEKIDTEQDEIETQYSDMSRELKILEHRFESNLSYLYSQTQQLESYYHFMILQEEQIDLKKQIITKQIKNKREKIQLRNASYTKQFNFIAPIEKNNDKPIQFITKHSVPKSTKVTCKQLKEDIESQKKMHIELDAKLHLLTRYYEIMKNKTICDNLEIPTQYKFDSQLGYYAPVGGEKNPGDSQCSIANCFQTPTKLLNKVKSQTKLGKSKSKAFTLTGVESPSKKTKQILRTPQTVFNLMKYKTEISKDMILQFEVYNLARQKRIKDETRLLKKQLEFVDEQIQHFDRSFEEELKKIQQLAKPKKVDYQTFKIDEKDNPFTRSPFSRDYHANNKGMNNINVYRPDNIYTSPRKNDKSKDKNKYLIQREQIKDLSLSRKQIATNLSVSRSHKLIESKPELGQTKAESQPYLGDLNTDEYGLYTMGQNLKEIPETPKKQIANTFKRTPKSKSKTSFSFREKNLTRFKTQVNLDDSKSPETSMKLRLNLSNRKLNFSRTKNLSQKTLSIQRSPLHN